MAEAAAEAAAVEAAVVEAVAPSSSGSFFVGILFSFMVLVALRMVGPTVEAGSDEKRYMDYALIAIEPLPVVLMMWQMLSRDQVCP